MKTKEAAIHLAKSRISGMYPVGGQWRFSTWCQDFAAWRESNTTDYFKSRSQMAQSRIDIAREALGKPERMYDGGRWETYV